MTVWSGASKESLKQLVIIQKRAVRTIAGVSPLENTGLNIKYCICKIHLISNKTALQGLLEIYIL